MKKRMYSWDLLRILSFFSILYYHMLVELQTEGIFPPEKINHFVFTGNGNIHIATLAVIIFFMLSGACLTYVSEDKINLKEFYSKHFLKLLVPYWITVFCWDLIRVISTGSLQTVLIPGVPLWRLIFTVFGLDTWFTAHGIANFSNGIGEWFLGTIIILYFVFPLFRFLMKKNEKIFFIASTAIYILVFALKPFPIDDHMNLLLKAYEFIVGMYFGKYLSGHLSWQRMIPCIIVICAIVFGPKYILHNTEIMTFGFAVMVFYVVTCTEDLLGKKLQDILRRLSGYSYEVFLVHHVIIQTVTNKLSFMFTHVFTMLFVFLLEIVLIIVSAILLHQRGRIFQLKIFHIRNK